MGEIRDRPGHVVVVHCSAGVARTGVTCCLIAQRLLSLPDAKAILNWGENAGLAFFPGIVQAIVELTHRATRGGE